MEKVEWQVEGMSCTNCALTISKYLQKEGMKNVNVNFIGGDVSFDLDEHKTKEELSKGIKGLGYKVMEEDHSGHHHSTAKKGSGFLSTQLQRFLFCVPFTLLLMSHMLLHIHLLMNPWIQLVVCLPVFIVGIRHFGMSAVRSLLKGVPNMDVLIALGSTAAFVYSLIGTIGNFGMEYVFYETAATIITLIFLGEFIENKAVKLTQKELTKLSHSQKVMANMIAFDDEHKENIFPVESTQLRVGDLILIKSGEQVPTDCKILSGDAHVNEALLTGESTPIRKTAKDTLLGGSILADGIIRAQVTATGKDTVLSNILYLVKQAQGEKPPIQQLADKISTIFVPTVVGIALLTFALNYFPFHIDLTHSLMRSIAVLVISCPCAMGLATPAAVAVGLGRAAKNGILFRDAKSLELFKNIRNVVFDKTGTLTKGNISIASWHIETGLMNEDEFKAIVFSLEKYSNHPIAKAVAKAWKTNTIALQKIEEIKGIGMKAVDKEGNIYQLGSSKIIAGITDDTTHTAYLLKNNSLVGWFDLEDEIRQEAKKVIEYLHSKNIQTYLLSGDSLERCKKVADALGIDEIYASKSPEEKLIIIEQLTNTVPTAMVGDGINDAPALAKATIGISMSEATQIAVQSAQVVLMNNGIEHLPLALGLGKHTFITIKENLFWAFFYNVVAIPVAAVGLLNPGIAALTMGLSDVVLVINSIRLNYRKVI
jgi:Cu+-exporting ATPase